MNTTFNNLHHKLVVFRNTTAILVLRGCLMLPALALLCLAATGLLLQLLNLPPDYSASDWLYFSCYLCWLLLPWVGGLLGLVCALQRCTLWPTLLYSLAGILLALLTTAVGVTLAGLESYECVPWLGLAVFFGSIIGALVGTGIAATRQLLRNTPAGHSTAAP